MYTESSQRRTQPHTGHEHRLGAGSDPGRPEGRHGASRGLRGLPDGVLEYVEISTIMGIAIGMLIGRALYSPDSWAWVPLAVTAAVIIVHSVVSKIRNRHPSLPN